MPKPPTTIDDERKPVRAEFAYTEYNSRGHERERIIARAFDDLMAVIDAEIQPGRYRMLALTALQSAQGWVRHGLIETGDTPTKECANNYVVGAMLCKNGVHHASCDLSKKDG
jgi:hypothetical protein